MELLSLEFLTAAGQCIAAFTAVAVAWMVWRGQKVLSQRQMILPLWEYMSSLHEVDPKAPITRDVLKIVNTLELVALCVEGGMVDERVIKRTFSGIYMKLYEQVQVCSEIPGLGRTGSALWKENPAAMRFFRQLEKEHEDQGALRG